MKTKMYKYALITSVISLIMCVSMFVGTTFAWFTDSVSSANNKILSGSLRIDVEVLQQDGRYKSIRGTNEALFNYDLWEPGIVQTANVRVVNDGTLALKYELQIEADGVIDSILNNELMLSDVIDVYYADKEVLVADSAQVDMAVANGSLTYIGTLTQVLLAGTLIKDYLLPENAGSPDGSWEDYATIALRMRAGTGNEYQDLSVFGSFDLRLLATQYTYEKDSFDNKYDQQLQKGLIFDDGKEHSVSEIVTLRPENEQTDVITAIGEGTVVNVTGGYYDVGSKDCAIWAKDGAVVNVYGGAFYCDGLGEEATSSNHQDLIYAGANGGTINIYGGLFSARSAGAWLLNEKDGEGEINLYGGTFVDWNPADNISEGGGNKLFACKHGSSYKSEGNLYLLFNYTCR